MDRRSSGASGGQARGRGGASSGGRGAPAVPAPATVAGTPGRGPAEQVGRWRRTGGAGPVVGAQQFRSTFVRGVGRAATRHAAMRSGSPKDRAPARAGVRPGPAARRRSWRNRPVRCAESFRWAESFRRRDVASGRVGRRSVRWSGVMRPRTGGASRGRWRVGRSDGAVYRWQVGGAPGEGPSGRRVGGSRPRRPPEFRDTGGKPKALAVQPQRPARFRCAWSAAKASRRQPPARSGKAGKRDAAAAVPGTKRRRGKGSDVGARARSCATAAPGEIAGTTPSPAPPRPSPMTGSADAIRILRPVRQALPNAPSVRELLGVSLYRAGQYKAAAEELEAYAQITGEVDQHPVLMDCARALAPAGAGAGALDRARRGVAVVGTRDRRSHRAGRVAGRQRSTRRGRCDAGSTRLRNAQESDALSLAALVRARRPRGAVGQHSRGPGCCSTGFVARKPASPTSRSGSRPSDDRRVSRPSRWRLR